MSFLTLAVEKTGRLPPYPPLGSGGGRFSPRIPSLGLIAGHAGQYRLARGRAHALGFEWLFALQ
jgi:hypothetical protein